MGKDPAVLFYTSDFLAGTAFFTKSQKGEYITLLCEQHQLYSIPEDHLIELCGSLDSPVVKKFKKDKDGTWYNQRMRDETNKRKNYCESRRKNIMERHHKKDKPLKNKHVRKSTYVDTCVLHMENENENRNKDKNRDEIEIPDHLKEVWPDFLKMRKLIKKPATERAQKNIISKLYKLSEYSEVQIEIIEQSIRNSWQDIYPLKDGSRNRKQYGKQEATRQEIIDQMNRIKLS